MLLLTVFIITIGLATFIEDTYDTATAQMLIYQAKWFEFLMLLLIVWYAVNVFQKNLLRKVKLPQLIFHLSFIVLFIGGGITRYFGYEAHMHIVENTKENTVYTVKPYLQVRTPDKQFNFTSPSPIYFSQIQNNDFQLHFDVRNNERFEISYQGYVHNAKEVKIDGSTSQWVPADSDEISPDALLVKITCGGKSYEAVLFYDTTRYTQPFKLYSFGDVELELAYGPKPVEIPFSLQLEKFTLTKYPGTEIPSASESKVTLIDPRNNLNESHSIYQNHVLDYDGYRFFQTSYDDDEKGTILSVNHDFYGTRVTYAGYCLMLIGGLLIMLSKNSHYAQLDKKIKQVRAKRKSLIITIIFLAGIQGIGFSQNTVKNAVSAEHADRFGHLLVQTYDGRFSSVHSLATDVVHKITGKNNFKIEGKGKMDPMQLFLDMRLDPDFWLNQKIIQINEQSLRNILGLSGKYASMNDFYVGKEYKLEALSQKAFQKKASNQSTLDREIIKASERVNIFLMTINGSILKIFPEQDSDNNKWISWIDEQAFEQLHGDIRVVNEDLNLEDFSYANIMSTYLMSTIYAREVNDYRVPEKLLGHISEIQKQLTPDGLLPSQKRIAWEVHYNKSRIFDTLKYVFGILGLILLALALIQNFNSTRSKTIQVLINIFVGLVIAAFIYQTYGMGLRWYLGGHAPWSNGYEVLLLVAWGGILAGFSVIKYSKITLAATALLAFLILMTAGHSYYDPQLTNLNPVLKSYWLIIHVAIITIGYGFLALSFLLALISLGLYVFKSQKQADLFSLIIDELTLINEKLLTIGLFLTAIGTFIGCVWANESWGNYWSWNAKQTWSLIIVLVYGVVLHFKYIPKMGTALAFNIGALISFGSVLMTFVGVNYYFTKGLHSYASDDPPVFPFWAWIGITGLLLLITTALFKSHFWKTGSKNEHEPSMKDEAVR